MMVLISGCSNRLLPTTHFYKESSSYYLFSVYLHLSWEIPVGLFAFDNMAATYYNISQLWGRADKKNSQVSHLSVTIEKEQKHKERPDDINKWWGFGTGVQEHAVRVHFSHHQYGGALGRDQPDCQASEGTVPSHSTCSAIGLPASGRKTVPKTHANYYLEIIMLFFFF